jgi:hypothetical protein
MNPKLLEWLAGANGPWAFILVALRIFGMKSISRSDHHGRLRKGEVLSTSRKNRKKGKRRKKDIG